MSQLNEGGTTMMKHEDIEHCTQQFTLYRAERLAPEGRRFGSQAEIQTYLDTVLLDSPWWEERFPNVLTIKCPTVKRGREGSVGDLDEKTGIGTIEMAPVHWFERVVLHEVAHVVCGEESTGHDPLFARTYLELVFRMMGFEAWNALRESFIGHEICFDPQCQYEPECSCCNHERRM